MSTFLHFLLQNTLSGTAFLLAVLLFRKATGGLSKLYVRILWLLALPVLLLPPLPLGSLYTARSFISDAPAFPEGAGADRVQQSRSNGEAGSAPSDFVSDPSVLPSADTGNSPAAAGERTPSAKTGALMPARGESGALTHALFAVWASGALLVTAACLLQWLRLKKSVSDAVKIDADAWGSDQIDTPFVMPGLPPRIYLPKGMDISDEQRTDILMHERRHIKNHDPLIKCLALPVLLLHWFNPFVWIALRLMTRDMEMYCDECVLRTASITQKQHYAQTLLDFACHQSGILPAVCFGESSTESRICHILHMKRTRTPIKLLLMLFILVCGFSFLTVKSAQAEHTGSGSVAKQVSERADGRGQTQLPENVDPHPVRSDARIGEKAAGSGSNDAQGTDAAGAATPVIPQAENNGAAREEEFWADQRIVGTVRPDDRTDDGLSKKTELLGETAGFALYGMNDGEAVVVKTPDDCQIYAPIPYTSTYEVPPALLENDFDEDGESELAVITYVMHGTGVSIRSLFMADHTADGSWKLFHYLDSDYIAELQPHFDTGYEPDGVRLLFEGTATGIVEQASRDKLDNHYGYHAGSQIDFRFVEDKILLRAQLGGYSDVNFSGEFSGHELDADVRYLGEGHWRLEGIRYADANINDLIELLIPLYLAGDVDDINEFYTVPGFTLKAPDQISEDVTILSVSYDAGTLENNTADVAVTLRRDGSEAPACLRVPLKRVPLDFGGMWWRIAGAITPEHN